MSSRLWSGKLQQRMATVEWVGRQERPFDLIDADRELGFGTALIRGVLRDMEARGLVVRGRGAPRNARRSEVVGSRAVVWSVA